MKKLIVLLFVGFCITKAKAQIPVTDVAANTQLQILAQQISTMNSTLNRLNQSANKTERNTKNNYDENERQRQLQEDVEDTYWTVDPYIRNGIEMKEILSNEKVIIKSLQSLRSLAGNLNYVDKTSILNMTKGLLSVVGKYVDTATDIVTDDKYRMTSEERRRYLTEMNGNLENILSELTNKISTTKSMIAYKKQAEEIRKASNAAIQNQKNIQQQLMKNRR